VIMEETFLGGGENGRLAMNCSGTTCDGSHNRFSNDDSAEAERVS